MKKVGFVLCAVFILSVYVALVVAAEKGNDKKGKYLFRKNCRSCHMEGGTAKELSPNSKNQADWQKVFNAYKTFQDKDVNAMLAKQSQEEAKSITEAYEKLSCKEEWKKLSDQDRLDIFTYVHDHAFDSPSPAKCS